jgi:hypothetical protein
MQPLEVLEENRICRGCGNVDFFLNYSKFYSFRAFGAVDFAPGKSEKSHPSEGLNRYQQPPYGAGCGKQA